MLKEREGSVNLRKRHSGTKASFGKLEQEPGTGLGGGGAPEGREEDAGETKPCA